MFQWELCVCECVFNWTFVAICIDCKVLCRGNLYGFMCIIKCDWTNEYLIERYIQMENVNLHLENNNDFEWKPRRMLVNFGIDLAN